MAPDASFTTVCFQLRGQKVTDTDAAGQATDYAYDNLGHLVSVTKAAVFDPATGLTVRPITQYGYNGYGNQTSITDALGRVTSFAFDDFGSQLSRTLPTVAGDPTAFESTSFNS